MKALLVRIGVDQAYGGWNAPVDAEGRFVYVPIPEKLGTPFMPGLERRYGEILPALERFCAEHDCDLYADLRFPKDLLHFPMHLDPDFESVTYGNRGNTRGRRIANLNEGDLLVFYGGLRPVQHSEQRLIYALVGTNDVRTDPFYEFGSFGSTKCHCTNLFHPRHALDLQGARLAFVQGGNLGARLVLLTPPITVKVWANSCEARWKPVEMPFKYAQAPVLVSNKASSDFPLIEQFVRQTDCPTAESALSSRLRSRARPLPLPMAEEIISVYEQQQNEKPRSAIASTYYEALPYVTKIDGHRKSTYQHLIRTLRAEADRTARAMNDSVGIAEREGKPRCRSSRCRQRQRRSRRCS